MKIKHFKPSFLFALFFLLCSGALAYEHAPSAPANDSLNKPALYAFIKRLAPEHAVDFRVEYIPGRDGKDCFELEGKEGKIILKGNNGVSVASAFYLYLKDFVHCDITWNGTNMKLPGHLPIPKTKIARQTPYSYRYYMNYCTFNYTATWWDWDRWQYEIDWMALHGINMPLAITGQNSIWRRVYKHMGFTDTDLSTFFSGPAYTNWFWMGNLDAWGGPLPLSFMQSQEELQKKILERERSFGMKPILPAFTGHVPSSFAKRFPNARLKKTHWVPGFGDVSILDPDDSLFSKIGSAFIKEEIQVYGSDHFYSADTFNENTPPSNDSVYLARVSQKVYQSMASADVRATWIMQGWLFVNDTKFWKQPQIRYLLSSVPNEHMIILDLFSETTPAWNQTQAFYSKPWIWCMLHNFGGNIGMFGRMDHVANDPAEALKSKLSGRLYGIGLTPEGIEQNPVMYELMLDNTWRTEPIDLNTWLNSYSERRYAAVNKDAEKAWQILRNTVYKAGRMEGPPESILSGRPTFEKETRWTRTPLSYNPHDLLPAWDLFIRASDDLKTSEGFRYDLVDLSRQVLANYADSLQQEFAAAYRHNDKAAFMKKSTEFLDLLDDMDRLLLSRKDFLLGRWLADARARGTTLYEKDLFEKNARDLISLWGDKNSSLHEYACKQWAGMISGFYKPRWELFFKEVSQAMERGSQVDMRGFEERVKNWEWNWVNSHSAYATRPKGDAVLTANELYKKYKNRITN